MKSLKLYEDRPAYGLLLRFIVIVVPGSLLATSFFVWRSGNQTDALWLLGEVAFISLLFWAIFPRSYQVYEDHLRIRLGGPFLVKVGFDNIKSVGIARGLNFGINFATAITKNGVEIVRKRGARINITPRAPEQFVENAERAWKQWQMAQGR